MAQPQINLDFAFFTYLRIFYTENRGRIRTHFRDLTKKFLDFNDPESGRFCGNLSLRR